MYNQERSGSVSDPRISSAEAPPRTELQQLAEGIERALKESSVALQSMSMLRDRLFGDRPTGVDKGKERPSRGGMLGGLHDRADDLNSTLNRLNELIGEVSRVA